MFTFQDPPRPPARVILDPIPFCLLVSFRLDGHTFAELAGKLGYAPILSLMGVVAYTQAVCVARAGGVLWVCEHETSKKDLSNREEKIVRVYEENGGWSIRRGNIRAWEDALIRDQQEMTT